MVKNKPDTRQQEFGFMKTVHTMTPEEKLALYEEMQKLEPRKFLQRAIESRLTDEERERSEWNKELEKIKTTEGARAEKMIDNNDRQFRYSEKRHLKFIAKWRRKAVLLPLERFVEHHFPSHETIHQNTSSASLLGQLQRAVAEAIKENIEHR